jgi:hypothetical protein
VGVVLEFRMVRNFSEGYLLTTRHGAVALIQASLDHFEGFYKREKPHRKLAWL